MLLQSSARSPEFPWAYYWYLTDSGRNNFIKWDARLSTTAKVKRNTAMKYLRVQPLSRWSRPEASSLGNHIYVIHFNDENRTSHRICGFVDLEHHAFVICATMIEKDGAYHPADYETKTLSAQINVQGNFGKHTLACPWGKV
jgi:hypothetical protein